MMNNIGIGYLQLTIVLAFGLPMIVHDVRYKKIPNKILLKAFVAGIFLYAAAYFFHGVDLHYLGIVFANFLFSIGVGYAFWALNLWPAGDAKFFFFLAFLYPIAFFRQNPFVFVPLLMLVNVFVIASVIMLLEMCYRTATSKNSISDIQMVLKAKVVETRNDGFLKFVLVIAKQVGLLLLINYVIAFFIFLFDQKSFQIIPSKTTILSVVAFWVYTMLTRWHVSRHEEKEISVRRIRSGMPMVNVTGKIFPKEFLVDLGSVRADGFTTEQAVKMKTFCIEHGIGKVNIVNNFAFSPWLLLGYLVTVFIQGSLLDVIVKVL